MKKVYFLAFITCTLAVFACKKNDEGFVYYYYSAEQQALLSQYLDLPYTPGDYNKPSPQYLQSTAGVFAQPLHLSKVELGRVLFYDKNLSKDQTISCASCHKQELAFGDNAPVSKGVFNRSGERNSISLSAVPSFAATYDNTGTSLFWDNRAKTVQDQSRASLGNSKEMDMTMPEVVDAVKNQPYYPILFIKAYGDESVTEDRVTESIQSFVHSLTSFRSKFDDAAEAQFQASQQDFNFVHINFAKFTAQENRGKQIYLTSCASCHSEAISTPTMPVASNGLDENPTDPGVGGITHLSFEMGTFKVPALRNVGLTAPYMHDGRFATLEAVVEHYSTGIKPHANLHPFLMNSDASPRNLNLSADDKQALIAFLRTLDDEAMLTDVRYKNPFKQ